MQLLTVSMVASPRPASIRASFFFRRSVVFTLVLYTNQGLLDNGQQLTQVVSARVSRGLFSDRLLSPVSYFHTCAETTHVAITGQEVVTAGDWLRHVLIGIEATCIFNAAVYPAPTQQESEGLAARKILSVERVIQRIAASAG